MGSILELVQGKSTYFFWVYLKCKRNCPSSSPKLRNVYLLPHFLSLSSLLTYTCHIMIYTETDTRSAGSPKIFWIHHYTVQFYKTRQPIYLCKRKNGIVAESLPCSQINIATLLKLCSSSRPDSFQYINIIMRLIFV